MSNDKAISKETVTFLDVSYSNDYNQVFVFDETETMLSYDGSDHWQRKRFDILMSEYVEVAGKEHTYYIRGSYLFGVSDTDKRERAKVFAIYYHKHRNTIPKWSLLD